MQSMTEDLQAQSAGRPLKPGAHAGLLIASLEPKTAAQQAWTELALKRREDVRAGRTQLVPGDEALARVRASLG